MPKKKKKESWKEKKRRAELKRQRALEAERIRIEREIERRRASKGRRTSFKVFGVICLIALVLISFGYWQSIQPSTEPPELKREAPLSPSQTTLASDFALRDMNGTQFSLHKYGGKVIVIHFMGVGCQGKIYPINDNQLKQLKTVCNSYCRSKEVAIITVAVASCPNSNLKEIRESYGVAWFLGNDLEDGEMDVVQAYARYVNEYGDGTVVLIDKTFHVRDSYGAIDASTLFPKIDELTKEGG